MCRCAARAGEPERVDPAGGVERRPAGQSSARSDPITSRVPRAPPESVIELISPAW